MVKFLGDAYHHGGHFGLVKSDKKAAKLYKKAVEQYGCVDAMYSLGEMYDTGDGTGVKLDKKKAMQLFRMAADRGHVRSAQNLGCLLSEAGDASAFKYFMLGAQRGYHESYHSVAVCYLRGEGVPSVDREEARRWLQRGADEGSEKCRAAMKDIFAKTLPMSLCPSDRLWRPFAAAADSEL
jgi:TPR repeat protein